MKKKNIHNGKKCPCGEDCQCGENCHCTENIMNSVNPSAEVAKITELTSDLQRTRADFENFRKQVEVQKENERKNAKIATVLKLLPLLDNFSLALGTYKELEPLKKTLEKTLKDLDLEPIPSAEGTEFNPDIFEAISAEGDGEREVVAETLRPGYYYEKEVLRPAMVKVKRI